MSRATPSPGTGPPPLAAQVTRSSKHQGIAAFAIHALSLAQTMVLARVFFPHEFGTLAAALAYVHFFQNVGIGGVSKQLVREESLDARKTATALWLSLGRDAALLVVYLAGILPFAAIFGQPELARYLLILAPVVLLNTLELPGAFLERGFRFRARNVPRFVELVSYPAIAVALHALGHGEESLFLAYTASLLGSRAILWWLHPIPIELTFDRRAAAVLLRFSAPIMGASVVAFLAAKLDDLFVNYFAGDEALGYYALAFYKPMFIISISNMLGAVLFPALSRVRRDRERTARYFTEASRFLAMFVFPAGMLVAVFAEPIVVELFSERWRPAADLLRYFALGIAIRVGITAAWLPLVTSQGRTRLALASSLVDLGLLVALGLPMIAAWGAAGGAWYFVAHAAVSIWIVPLPAIRRIVGDLRYLRVLVLPLGASLLTAAAALGMQARFDGGLPGLAMKGAASLALYGSILLVCERRSLREAVRLLRLAGSRG